MFKFTTENHFDTWEGFPLDVEHGLALVRCADFGDHWPRCSCTEFMFYVYVLRQNMCNVCSWNNKTLF